MNALIPVQNGNIGGEPVQTVNARELHEFLGVGRDFSSWVKDQIGRARLVEGRDYLLTEKGEQLPSGTKYLKDYHLTIDAAKHVAMMSGSDKGFEVRDYFIECERIARNPVANLSRTELLRLALDSEERRAELEQKVAEDAPKVDVYERLVGAEGTVCMRDAAKALQVRPTDLKNLLVVQRWIYGRPGHSGWLAYQDRIQQGYLVHKVNTFTDQNTGDERIKEQVRITAKGLARLAKLLSTPQKVA